MCKKLFTVPHLAAKYDYQNFSIKIIVSKL